MNAPTSVFDSNVKALARRFAGYAQSLRPIEPASLRIAAAKCGVTTAAVEHEGQVVQLASRFDPPDEAASLLDTIKDRDAACLAILGFGLGYHVREALKRLGKKSVLIVYEPDERLFRAVMEIIDLGDIFLDERVIVLVGEISRAELTRRLEPLSMSVLLGTVMLTHPPTRTLREASVTAFSKAMADFLAYARTQLATVIVNSTRTVENYMGNLGRYAAGPGTDELHHAARDVPAVCVGAGPSLARNLHLLSDPKWRERVIVISAQTTLKLLLARGITPDFVTALDYAAVSSRFYEDLPRLDRCTLVVEPMVHANVPEAYPGPVRMTQSRFLERLLGQSHHKHPIPYGATVAHLSFYLAQHLGCNPIMLVGQDLGFSEGLYYCPGTPVHDAWMPELNPFNTLEMMEWRRVVSSRPLLFKAEDVRGRAIHTDEQMTTYLKQFERDFAAASQTVIDCTEGGVPKQNTLQLSLEYALERYAYDPAPAMPDCPTALDPGKLMRSRAKLDQRRKELTELQRLSEETLGLLEKLAEVVDRPDKFNIIVRKVSQRREKVMAMVDIFGLIEEFNAIGVFNRLKADRAIAEAEGDELTMRAKQVERDTTNVRWIVDACTELLRIFDQTVDRQGSAVAGSAASKQRMNGAPGVKSPQAGPSTKITDNPDPVGRSHPA